MKRIAFFILLFASINMFADQHVIGYYKSNGTNVDSYMKSSPNNTKSDNFSTYGNVNPYTGQAGTKTYSDYNNYGHNKSSNSNSSGYKGYNGR